MSSALELYGPYIKGSVLKAENWFIRRHETPDDVGKSKFEKLLAPHASI